jgi:hypothetical protein
MGHRDIRVTLKHYARFQHRSDVDKRTSPSPPLTVLTALKVCQKCVTPPVHKTAFRHEKAAVVTWS